MIILINVGMFVVSVIVFVIGIIGTIAVFEVEIEKRKRDVTKDEQDFLDWMKVIPDLLQQKQEIVNHNQCGQIRRWYVVNRATDVVMVDHKYHNYILIKSSGEIRGCNSEYRDSQDGKDDESFIIYDFRFTKKLSEFKKIYNEFVNELRIQKETKEEELRSKKASDIIQKMRTG